MGQIKWKLDDRGKPRRLPAGYIMRRDPRAKTAYTAMRRRCLSAQEAEHEIETSFQNAFRETLIFGIDRRLEIWIALEEGLRTADLFADIETALNQKSGEGAELIRRVRQPKREFIVYDGPECT